MTHQQKTYARLKPREYDFSLQVIDRAFEQAKTRTVNQERLDLSVIRHMH